MKGSRTHRLSRRSTVINARLPNGVQQDVEKREPYTLEDSDGCVVVDNENYKLLVKR